MKFSHLSLRAVPLAAAAIAGALSLVSLSAQTAPPLPPVPASPNMLFFRTGISVEGKVVKGAPYSATSITTLTQTLSNGTHIVQKEQSTLARDADGRTRREESLQKIGPWSTVQPSKSLVFINDPVAHVQYVLEPDSQTGTRVSTPDTTSSLRAQKLAAEAANGPRKMVIVSSAVSAGPEMTTSLSAVVPDGAVGEAGTVSFHKIESEKDAVTETLPDQVIEGLTVHGKRVTSTIAAGAIGNDQPIAMIMETWYSPDLQMVVLSKHSDPRVGDTVTALTGVSRAEPAPSLFQVPAGFTIKDSDEPVNFVVKVQQ